MGAKPRWVLLAGSLPEANEAWLAAFADGLFACAKRYAVDLIGGDTTRGPLNLCVTALGEVPAGKALRRDGARPGDDLWMSGQPGLAALGLAQLQNKTELPEPLKTRCITALQRPLPRIELGQALQTKELANSAIDVSDGLLADVGHIAERSKVTAEVFATQLPRLPGGVDAALARQAQLAGGDDYELIFSASPDKRYAIAELAAQLDLPLWRIGRISEGNGTVRLLDDNGHDTPLTYKGFDHFGHGSQ
jgi:thiamine-monophosphate kinase